VVSLALLPLAVQFHGDQEDGAAEVAEGADAVLSAFASREGDQAGGAEGGHLVVPHRAGHLAEAGPLRGVSDHLDAGPVVGDLPGEDAIDPGRRSVVELVGAQAVKQREAQGELGRRGLVGTTTGDGDSAAFRGRSGRLAVVLEAGEDLSGALGGAHAADSILGRPPTPTADRPFGFPSC